MEKDLIARASISINAPIIKVWEALINPEIIKQYMFGAEVTSDWKVGSSIVWKGIWKGKPYEDKGVIIKIDPVDTLQYSHFSPLSGLPDLAENYNTITYTLLDEGEITLVSLTQDNNRNEKAKEDSQKMWENSLAALRKVFE